MPITIGLVILTNWLAAGLMVYLGGAGLSAVGEALCRAGERLKRIGPNVRTAALNIVTLYGYGLAMKVRAKLAAKRERARQAKLAKARAKLGQAVDELNALAK